MHMVGSGWMEFPETEIKRLMRLIKVYGTHFTTHDRARIVCPRYRNGGKNIFTILIAPRFDPNRTYHCSNHDNGGRRFKGCTPIENGERRWDT